MSNNLFASKIECIVRNNHFTLAIILLLIFQSIKAQESVDSPVFKELKKSDSLVFNEGFNKCNFDVMQISMHNELQFFHDQNGIQNRDEFFKVFKESICSNPNGKPVRKLIDESLVVYTLRNEGKLYGAIQMGMHEFFIVEPGKKPRITANGKFIHTWLLEKGKWKLFYVVSYDHQQLH